MKLVLTMSHGDGYTYGYDSHTPVEYKSSEDFLVDFDEWKLNYPGGISWGEKGFAGTWLNTTTEEWKIQTLEEWFEENLE